MEWVLAISFGLGGVMIGQSAWDLLEDLVKRHDRG
jgi:hypothetical protein